MALAFKLDENDISYIDDELRNNEPFHSMIVLEKDEKKYHENVELVPKHRSKSEPLLEIDNIYISKPTSGLEIDDIDADDKYYSEGRNGLDRGWKTEILPQDPRIYPILPDINSVKSPDVNVYQQKKIIAQGMMDLALISANASQFRYILHTKGQHPYYITSLSMIGISLFLQIVVGIGLIWNGRFNVKVDDQMFRANRTNNWIVIGVFTVTILNVFISTFSVPDWTDFSYNRPYVESKT